MSSTLAKAMAVFNNGVIAGSAEWARAVGMYSHLDV
jgi:tagatose-1,6-bisphosphate aldolase